MKLPFTTRDKWDTDEVIAAGAPVPYFATDLGRLYQGDCLEILRFVKRESVDMVFADPPFNIGKKYGKSVDDDRNDKDYVKWCETWIDECTRILKPGPRCSSITSRSGT